jgi:hypothetical protein
MNWLNTSKSVSRPTSALAILAICASLLLAAVGLSVTNVPAGTTMRQVHDPENPAYVGNTIGSSTAFSRTSQVIRDPENPYWTGATIGSTTAGGSSTPNLK